MTNHTYGNQQTIIGYATLCAIFSAINLALQAVNESLHKKHQNGSRKGSSSIHHRR